MFGGRPEASPVGRTLQNLAGFPGGKRTLGDVVAKDDSFAIAGL